MFEPKIKIGVSFCLLGERVRYDGSHKFDRLVADVLASTVELLPICPEAEIGMGVPRPPIHLVRNGDEVEAVSVENEFEEFTHSLQSLANARKHDLISLSGYIFKSKSPSCGLTDVPIIELKSQKVMNLGSGVYANSVREMVPALPVEDELRLNNWDKFHNFMERVQLFKAWQSLDKGNSHDKAKFHQNGCIHLLARSRRFVNELNNLFLSQESQNTSTSNRNYIVQLMHLLSELPSRSGHARAMRSEVCSGTIQLSSNEKEIALQQIDLYENREIKLGQLLVRFYESPWHDRKTSSYLNPYPRDVLLSAMQHFNDQH